MPDDAALQIHSAAEGIDHLAREHVLHQRVDRKIAPLRRLAHAQKRIDEHREILVAAPCCAFAARHGDVQFVMPQPEYAKARAHRDAFAQRGEDRLQLRRRHAVHLDVHVLVFHAPEAIAYKAAHVKRPAAL